MVNLDGRLYSLSLLLHLLPRWVFKKHKLLFNRQLGDRLLNRCKTCQRFLLNHRLGHPNDALGLFAVTVVEGLFGEQFPHYQQVLNFLLFVHENQLLQLLLM